MDAVLDLEIENGELSCYRTTQMFKIYFNNDEESCKLFLSKKDAKKLGEWLIKQSDV